MCFYYSFKPIVVLTDLRDEYTFCWLNNHVLYLYAALNAAAAWGLLDTMLSSETVTEKGVVVCQNVAEAQQPLTKRQCLQLDTHDGNAAATSKLMELEGCLDPEELRASRAVLLLQEFMRIPSVAAVRAAGHL